MTEPPSIRAARVHLAMALMHNTSELPEAAYHLHRALDEPGDDPPDWRIHLHLGRLADQDGDDPVAALSELLAATIAAPPADADEPASVAFDVLNRASGHRRWATRLDDSQVAALVSCARAGEASSAIVRLAATVALLRGDAETAGSLVSATSDADVRADPAIGTAQAVARASELVDHGDFAQALASLDATDAARYDPLAASARAWALYGLGDLDAALEAVADVPETFDTALAQALVWLRRAGERVATDDGTDPMARARTAASAAARLEPAVPDGLLLRAQVELEGGLDTGDGRRLLQQAILRLEGEPERARHWRLQQRVRHDDAFRYMTIEVAAECGRTAELFALTPEELPFAATTYKQDAAAADLVAAALKEAGRLDEAADFFEVAGSCHGYAAEPDLALEAKRQAAELHPTPDRLLVVADELWQASYREPDPETADRTIAEALDALDRLEHDGVDPDREQRVGAAYNRGLALARRRELRSASLLDRWLPLPWLLVAALDDPSHTYRAAHLAWSLNHAGLARSAMHFAERGIELDETDKWLRETYVVMYFNWHGVLDAKAQSFIDDLGYVEWGAAMRETDALNRNDPALIREHLDGPSFDALWARLVRAQSTARLDGIPRAEPLFRAVLDEAANQLANPVMASETALVLGDADAARRYIEEGVAAGMVTTGGAKFRNALVDLVVGEPAPIELLEDVVERTIEPATLRDWAYSIFPILAEAWARNPEAVRVLEALQQKCEARLEELATLPSLTIEIDRGLHTSTDPELDRLVRELLNAEEHGGVADAAIAEGLRRLAEEAPALPHADTVLDALVTPR